MTKPRKKPGVKKKQGAGPSSGKRESDQEKAAEDLIWGVHPVLEALRSRPRRILNVVVQKSKSGPKIQEIIQLVRAHNLKLRFVSDITVAGAGRISHQGVVARTAAHTTVSLDDLLIKAQGPAHPSLFLALDCIQDPHNLGAIIRSASAAGVTGIILPKDRTAPLAGTAAKAAAGSIALVDICIATNLVAALTRLKEEGFWIYGADGTATQSLYQADFAGPICLVVGGEGKGMRPLVRKECDFLVSIPMRGSLDSLNVSVATAVILFEMVRRRGFAK